MKPPGHWPGRRMIHLVATSWTGAPRPGDLGEARPLPQVPRPPAPNRRPMDPRSVLRETFGFPGYLPGQREAMSALWRHRAALAVFPTGGGKSLCYQLPAVLLDGLTLVVSPLIALMKDQVDFLRERGIAAARLDTSLTLAESQAVLAGLRHGMLKLLYVAPERFANERFLAGLAATRIALFAVDEAHCISEWGHNFRPDYLKLARLAREIGAERILALTATATPAVVRDICAGFGIPPEAAIVTGFYRPNLRLRVTAARSGRERDALLLERLRERPPGATIVYVTLQRTAEQVAATLAAEGLPARPYHAGMPAEERAEVQDGWSAAPDGIVVATIAFGMGIDKPDVRYVYHYNVPKSLESYSQEIGRAGRDGLPSIVEMFASRSDLPVLQNFACGDTPTRAAVERLVREALASPGTLEVAEHAWCARLDVRPTVLKTAFTYLELLGALRQGTPRYGQYRLRLADGAEEGLEDDVAELLALARQAKRTAAGWVTLDAEAAAEQLGWDRPRLVRAVAAIEGAPGCEVQASDLRQVYEVAEGAGDRVEELAAELVARFERREAQEIRRLEQVIELATMDGCMVNALVGHFGERREAPCGHCSWCETRKPVRLSPRRAGVRIEERVNAGDLAGLRAAHPEALGEPRQVARFLCGLRSPAASAARLGGSPPFGCLEGHPFADVLAWAERLPPVAAEKEAAQ